MPDEEYKDGEVRAHIFHDRDSIPNLYARGNRTACAEP